MLILKTRSREITPLRYVRTEERSHFGYSDTEIGIKYRFLDETDSSPQVGCFPLIEIPTGNANKELGNGDPQILLPVWIQKSWGKLTTYGGGGLWLNTGHDQKDSFFTGWEIQYEFSETVTLGSELYHQTAVTADERASSGFNLGGVINVSEQHHLLFSIGHTFTGEGPLTGYLAYQYTL